MKDMLRIKLHSERGVNRLVAIIAILAIVLAIVAFFPVYRAYKTHADELGCLAAMKKAQDMLDVEYMISGYKLSLEDAKAVVERSKWEMDTVCAAGGDYFLVEDRSSEQVYRIVCGLHDPDTYERTRVNAFAAYEMLQDALFEAERDGQAVPDRVTLTMNSIDFEAVREDVPNELRYGTDSTVGFKGTVIFFSVGDDGSLDWFVYADKNHAAVWRAADVSITRAGWTGDAFTG